LRGSEGKVGRVGEKEETRDEGGEEGGRRGEVSG